MDIHFYHHIGAETLEFLQKTGVPGITNRLDNIQETLNIMGQNQDEIKKTLEEVQAEQAASAARWEVRNTAQQQTITDLKELVGKLEEQNANSDAELSDELALAKQILRTEQDTFADATAPVSNETAA